MAPEVQLEMASYATTACDMFSLGSLICAVYNAGNTPIAAAYNLPTYAVHAKQVLNCIVVMGDSPKKNTIRFDLLQRTRSV